MSPNAQNALLLSIDIATGMLIVGAAWWLFSVLSAGKTMPLNTPDGVTGAQPSDPEAEAGTATTVSTGDLASVQNDPFWASSNMAVFN